MARVKIFTSNGCGWAVRNYAALLEKGIAFKTVPAVDRHGTKTDEFLAATPYGMTPVLVDDDTCVFESTLINEYIDDEYPLPPLLPAEPVDRVAARKWIHFCESRLFPALTRISRADCLSKRQVAIDGLKADIDWFDENALRHDWRGPYFFGDLFSLLDIAFFTVFDTMQQLEGELGVVFAKLPASVETWQNNIIERPSIQEANRLRKQIPF